MKSSLTPDSSGQLHVFGHESDSLGMDGAHVRVFKETCHKRLSAFLKSQKALAGESQILVDLRADVLHHFLEWKAGHKQVSRSLKLLDLAKGHHPWSRSESSSHLGGSLHSVVAWEKSVSIGWEMSVSVGLADSSL